MWWLHGAVSGHDMLFRVYYPRPLFITERAVYGAPSDFVVIFVHVFEYLVFIHVVFFAAGAVPVIIVIMGARSYAVIEYFHHHLRWSSSLFVSHDFMFIRCFFGVFLAYVSPMLLLSCVWWDQVACLSSNVCFEVVYVCKGHGAVWALYVPNGSFSVHAGGV